MAEKEVTRDLSSLTDRRLFVEEKIGDYSELVKEFLLGSTKRKEVTDGESVTNFSYNFANEPETRHEAHWQLQSFVLLELLREVKELKAAVNGKDKQPKLKRRK